MMRKSAMRCWVEAVWHFFSIGLLFALLVISLPNHAAAQERILGYGDSTSARELAIEKQLQNLIQPTKLDSLVKQLSSFVRIAGTSADREACAYVVKTLKDAGLKVKEYPYKVYMPQPTHVSLEMEAPFRHSYDLHERVYPIENKDSKEYPWVNGNSGNGAVEGEVVYVNYGLEDDYAALDSLGISLRGKIAIARYGKSYRGVKAALAEKHGASALLLYSDPSSDGYVGGDVFPKGPMRPMDGIQRGSIYNGHGDPTTPGEPSLEGAKRVSPSVAVGLVRIPVIPVSSEIALDILNSLSNTKIPNQSWQGALPLRYHVGAGPARLKLSVQCDSEYRRISNTIATVEGASLPNEWVIVGGHRDAWGPGAEDNGSGCAAVMAAAEAIAKLAREGIRPKRSILFATWDAEEWGLIGSTEWVEQLMPQLLSRAVAYINEDECATGKHFDCGSDPLLRSFLWQVVENVSVPKGRTIEQLWAAQFPDSVLIRNAAGSREPEIGLLGGGSDFESFEGHLGIPSISQGFDGPFGQYHSMHDNYYYVRHFGDTSFVYHAAIARLAAVEALRFANADIEPYDFAELANALEGWVHHVRTIIPANWSGEKLAILDSALHQMGAAGRTVNEGRDRILREQVEKEHQREVAEHFADSCLHKLLFAFAPEKGITGDSWQRNILVCTDPANGYADMTLPNLSFAIRSKNAADFALAVSELLDVVRTTTSGLSQLSVSLQAKK